MMRNRRGRIVLGIAAFAAALSLSRPAGAQPPANATLDEAVAPGNNYDKAEFRLC